ncbi:MAG: two-component sensor histidine kinase, partial [Geobacteraceae bacterium]|nr:two-component sensor histidine kinase [Geobacteraceae bacterium]
VRKLLEFSRESRPVVEKASLEDIIEEALPLFINQPEFNNIQIRKSYSEALPQVSVDTDQILQVFINLIINAGHAMMNGGLLEISTWLSVDGKSVCASLKDSGAGISEEDFERIFDPFFTTKTDGTGLGLSISYGIIQNNGGSIDVQSSKGEGTVFTLTFPVSG